MRPSDSVAVFDPATEGVERGPAVAVLGFALLLSAVAVDDVLTGRLSQFFDLSFVVICLVMAAMVRRADFWLVAVLPPVQLLVIFILIAATAPRLLSTADDGLAQSVITGLTHHSVALTSGYALCLGWLLLRHRTSSSLPRALPAGQASNRLGSPAP